MSGLRAPMGALGRGGPHDGLGARAGTPRGASAGGAPTAGDAEAKATTGGARRGDGDGRPCRLHALPGPCAAESSDHVHAGRHTAGGDTLGDSRSLRDRRRLVDGGADLLRWARHVGLDLGGLRRSYLRALGRPGDPRRAGGGRPARRDTAALLGHSRWRLPGLVTRCLRTSPEPGTPGPAERKEGAR